MELVKSASIAAPLEGFSRLPRTRQVAVLIGLAAVLAMIGLVLMWSQEPVYGQLYGRLNDKDASEVIEALDASGMSYKLDEGTGAVMVPAGMVHETRIRLAGQGLPRGGNAGFELLDEQGSSFGVSQFMENARYQRAVEGELSRSIASIENIKTARVHLAMPKKTVFVRDRVPATASVVVHLANNRVLKDKQVEAIVHLVASSIPELQPDNVTVVDQSGRLLTSSEDSPEMELNERQYTYTKRVEKDYIAKVEDILRPIVGPNGVKAQVDIDMDFTVSEVTQEMYNPDQPAVRSQQKNSEQVVGRSESGIPGALSNEPPGETQVPEVVNGETGTIETPIKSKSQETTNYELDRTISRTVNPTGVIRRLSIAVVVDDHLRTNEEGGVVRVPRSEDELAQITANVKTAVGFNAARGDKVSVINASFVDEEEEAVEKWYEQAFVWDIAKQISGAMIVLFLIFIIIRPILRSLSQVPEPISEEEEELGELEKQKARMQEELEREIQVADYETNLQTAKNLAKQDPKRVATVVRAWVLGDMGVLED